MQVSGIVSREYSTSQLCSICHDIPVPLHTPGADGPVLTTVVTSSRWSSGQDMELGGLGMANSKSDDYNLFNSG